MSGSVEIAVAALRGRGADGPFACALVLGSGLGAVAEAVEAEVVVPYDEIPGFPVPRVAGHGGRVVVGRLGGRRILVLAGRVHAYETGDAGAMRVPIATVAALGAGGLVLTNASGGIRPDLGPGSLAVLSDHIGIGAPNPLVGETGDARFVPMADCYDPALRRALAAAAERCGVAAPEAVYMWFSGPSFETAAEIRAARALGADLVGMSTVPEVVLARFHGLRVAAVSVVTNHAAGLGSAGHSHADTQRAGREAAARLTRLLGAFLERIDDVRP